jgi:hypothetical protein
MVHALLLLYPYVIRDGLDQKQWTEILQETFKLEREGLLVMQTIDTQQLDRQIRTAIKRALKKIMPDQML